MSDNNYGVINEQGYPVGQFGFKPVSEAEKAAIEKDEQNRDSKNKDTNNQKG